MSTDPRALRDLAENLYSAAMRDLTEDAPSLVSEIEYALSTVAPRIMRRRLLYSMRPAAYRETHPRDGRRRMKTPTA